LHRQAILATSLEEFATDLSADSNGHQEG